MKGEQRKIKLEKRIEADHANCSYTSFGATGCHCRFLSRGIKPTELNCKNISCSFRIKWKKKFDVLKKWLQFLPIPL